MGLLEPRKIFMPFQYTQCYNYWMLQQSAFWLPFEIQMAKDVADFKSNLSQAQKNVIGNTVKGFVQTENFVQEYWSNRIASRFKIPEVAMMSISFANMEGIHSIAYSYLEETLGIQDYEAFLHEPTAKAKIDRLISIPWKTKEDIGLSLAIFSAFTEGVNLFSSFCILMNFSRFNLMPGLGKIIEFSVKDESLHSTAGCYLFRTFINEYPEIWTDDFKREIYQAARTTVELEDNFIDKVFELGSIPGLDPKDIKNYIRFRCNTKLSDLGLKSNWKNIDKDSLKKLEWFNIMVSGVVAQDFFADRDAGYSKIGIDFEECWKLNG